MMTSIWRRGFWLLTVFTALAIVRPDLPAQGLPGRLMANSGSSGGGLIEFNVDGSNPFNLTSNTFDHGVAPPAGQTNQNLSAHPSVAANGTVAFHSNRDDSGFRIFTMKIDGTGQKQLTSGAGLANDTWDQYPVISPDGSRIAFISRRSGRSVTPQQNFADIFMVNVDGSGLKQVSTTQVVIGAHGPEYSDFGSVVWSPDGQSLAFRGRRRVGGEWRDVLGRMAPDGTSEAILAIVGDCAGGTALDWAPDDSRIVYTYGGSVQGCPTTVYNIYPITSGTFTTIKTVQLGEPPGIHQGNIRFSPDGTRLVYQGYDNNKTTVLMIGIDGSGRTVIPSSSAAFAPLWWLPGAAIPTPTTFRLLPNPVSVFKDGPPVRLMPALLDAQGNTIVKALTGLTQDFNFDAYSVSQTGEILAKSSDAKSNPLCASNAGFKTCTTVLTNTCSYTLSPGTKSFTPAGGSVAIGVTATGTTCAWSASTNATWLTISSGSSGAGNGTVTLQAGAHGGATNRTGTLTLGGKTVTVNQAGTSSAAPFGSLDTPTDGATGLTGSVPITGWALDDLEVAAVQILRDPVAGEPAGLKLIGNAVVVNGARPDIAAGYPAFPFNTRAGWGYLLLTNMLPNQGNGTYKLSVNAIDVEGKATLLGARTIACTNNTATLPFGAIDTPAQGETISGSTYINFGWALTPLPKAIPTDGSTLAVFIDGAFVGRPSYNNFRSDIATLFPGLNNSAGPVGFLALNTEGLTDGTHTIAWSATDNTGAVQGIGSRYFNVQNATLTASSVPTVSDLQAMRPVGVVAHVRQGFNANSRSHTVATAANGALRIVGSELGRVEIQLAGDGAPEPCARSFEGYSLVLGKPHLLPIGSALDRARGVFTWHPGVGFHGAYDLLFVATDCSGTRESIRATVILEPRSR